MFKYKTHVKTERHTGSIAKTLAAMLSKLFNDRAQPILIAVGGPGGTGKSTLCRQLSMELKNASVLTLDDYKTDRETRKNNNIYGPHPDANKISLIHKHLLNIKKGIKFDKPIYCADKGNTSTAEPFNPTHINIIDGEISTYREFRDLIDFSIFVDSDWTTQLQTRISRDVEERGYSRDKAIATFLHSNLREFAEFGAESKKWADIHVHCHANYRLELESIAQEHLEMLNSILPMAVESIRIEGLIVPPCTPFDDNGNIDERAFAEHLDYLAENGVTRILVNGTTAEFFSLLPDERRMLLGIARRYFSGIIIFNTASDSLAQAKEAAHWGEDYGADAISTMTPYYYADAGEEGLIKFFNELHDSVNVPTIIYNYPKHTGNVITPNILRHVKHIAIKDSAKDFSLIPATPCYLAGTNMRAVECMANGAKGFISARACCAPKTYVGMELALAIGAVDKIQLFQNEIIEQAKMFGTTNEVAYMKKEISTQIPNYPTSMRLPLLGVS